MKRMLACILFLWITHTLSAQQNDEQKPLRHQLSLVSDNDFYLAQYNDRYYTNGIFFNYNWVVKQPSAKKIIHSLQLGQLMYNPIDYEHKEPEYIDRPYAGFLFLTYSQTHFFGKESVLQFSATGGITGKPSLTQALQQWYHHTVGFKKPEGWKYQVTAEPGLNMGALYATTLFPTNNQAVAIKPVIQASLGNTFTNAKAGFLFQLGSFEKNSQSIAWNASVSNTHEKTRHNYELYFYFYPQIIAQGYNATVQGGLFVENKGLVKDVMPFMYQHTIGGMYSEKHIYLGLSVVYQTKEARTQIQDQRYGSILFGYRF
ncbi:MAG: lipid A deacylase LpxR family protein [Filimonas sp.]|nr:lipid A deacylase LpxR family protein [Filimonas sp.]